MKDIDVMIINLFTEESMSIDSTGSKISTMPPLGQLYISSVLQSNGYEVMVLDLGVENMSNKQILEKIQQHSPKIVGFSSYYGSWSMLKEITTLIKREFEDIVITVGGNSATFNYEEILNEMKVNYIILGEGEFSFLKLCDYVIRETIPLEHVEGIAYKQDNSIRKTEVKRISNLDELPFPNRELIKLHRYRHPFTIATARGCIGKCIFCSSQAFWKDKITFRSIDNVILELEHIKNKFDAKEFFIIDDTFTLNKARVLEFCDKLIKKDLSFYWFCESRVDVISEEVLIAMYEAGCRWIQFGMESGNDEILAGIRKNISFSEIEEAIRLATNIGFRINLSLIIGHHLDTKDTIKETLEKAKYLKRKYQVNVLAGINTPYPGTEVFEKRDEYGLKILTKNWDRYKMDNPVMDTKYLKANELKRLHFNFMKELEHMDRS